MRLTVFLVTAAIMMTCYAERLAARHPGRDDWQQPERMMDSIGVAAGMTIGEPGAGDGYFTLKLAHRVGPEGRIFANDIAAYKLEQLRKKAAELSFENITTILGEVEDPLFPDSTMDMVIMVYVFHDLEKPVPFLQNLRRDLKEGAGLYLIERDPERFGAQFNHFMTRDEVVEKVRESGFRVLKIIDDFPRDNIYVCVPDAD